MIPIFRLLLTVVVAFCALAGAQFLRASTNADLTPELTAASEGVGADYWETRGALFGPTAKIALGNNANAVLSLDLIADGGAGNQRDDGVTAGAVSGRGTKIAIEIFATGVTTSLRGFIIRFDFDASLVSYGKAENNTFALSIPEASVGTNFASSTPVTLAPSGFLARAEFETVADVSDREFTIGIEKVTIAESSTSSDEITTVRAITLNATLSPDFDGDGTVGFSDFLAFAGGFGASQGDSRYEARFDLNGDGSVGFSDFVVFAGAFGSQVPPSGGNSTVTIADDNLRAVIADSLGKPPNATVTRTEMATLTRIAAPNRSIRNLAGIEYATNLQWLNLGRVRVDGEWVNSNQLSDLSPLSHLTNLTYLSLTGNRISSISALSNLTNLTQLHLGGNQSISDISPLSDLTELTALNLWDNSISDVSALSDLTNLTYLSLTGNRISSISTLSSLTNLTSLGLHGNSISDISPLSNLTKLTSLFLGRWRVNGEWNRNEISDLSPLSRLTNLTHLSLTGNRISSISALSNLTKLSRLNLWGNSISNISALSRLTDPSYLGLNDNDISDISPLVANTGLGDGDAVDLRSNPLSSTSRNTHIPTLQRRGVSVEFDSSNNGGGGGTTPPSGDYQPLAGLRVSEGRVQFLFFSAGDCIQLSNTTVSGVSYTAHTSKWQRKETSGWVDVSGTERTGLCSYSPTLAGEYRLVAEITVNGVRGKYASENTLTVGGTGGGGSGNPDLIVVSPSVNDNTLTTGQSFTLRATVRNQGSAAAAATTLRYYHSSNASISTDDTEVGTDAVSGLSAGDTSAESIRLNAPSGAGTYYYGACVESVSGESDTDNNCSSGVRVTVTTGSTGSGNLGACSVGLVVRPNQSCTVSGGAFRNIGGGCYNYTPFGSGRFCGNNFNLNGLRGTRVGNDYRITAVP